MIYSVYGITGVIAIVLMFIHGLGAFIVLLCNDENAWGDFHRFSVFVWLVWLIPYFSPMVLAIAQPAT